MKRHFVLANSYPTVKFNETTPSGKVGCDLHLEVELTTDNVLNTRAYLFWHDTNQAMGALDYDMLEDTAFQNWANMSTRISCLVDLHRKYGQNPITDSFDLKVLKTILEL